MYVPMEDYRLEVGYIYGSESFIVGNKAKIILHPRLYLQANSMKVDLGLVKDVKITVDMENNQGIKNTLEFDDVKFSSSKDYVLEVPIQSYIKRIDIAVTGVVKDTYSENPINVSSRKRIEIALNENSLDFIDLYMKKKPEGYGLHALGKNGEAIPNLEVRVSYKVIGYQNLTEVQLVTSSGGEIKRALGVGGDGAGIRQDKGSGTESEMDSGQQ